MPPNDQVAIAFTADVADLQRGTDQAASAVASSVRKMDGAVGGLGSTIKAFARDQRSEARAAGFFVQELAQIVPIAGQAKTALTGLGASMVGGLGLVSGLGAALAVLGYIATAFREAEAEAKKLAEESRKIGDALAEAHEKQAVAMARVLGGPVAEANAQREAELAKQRRAINALGDAIAAKEKELAEKRGGAVVFLPGIRNLETAIGNLKGQLDTAYKSLSTIAITTEEKVTEALRVEADKRKKIRADEMAAARKEYERRLEDARFRAREGEAYGISEDANLLARGAPTPAPKRAPMFDAEETVDAFAAAEIAMAGLPEMHKVASRGQDEYNQSLRESIELSQQWGEALAGTLTDLATGQVTAAQAVAQIGRMVLQSVMKNAIAQITANAGVAGSEAAKSQAGIPVIGPALALAAMGAMVTSVLGLLSKVPSAAGGLYRVPFDQPVFTHKDEQILPAAYAEGLRKLIEGGGGRGGKGSGPLVAVYATDTRDFARAALDSGSDLSEALRKIRRANRGGGG